MNSYEALGVVAIGVHNDSPLLNLATKVINALATGNTVVLVANKLAPLSAFMFLDVCVQSGVPAGVLNVVMSG